MNRRKFLGMVGLAPVVPALLKSPPSKPQTFWAGTTIPRNMPLTGNVPVVVSPFITGGSFCAVLQGEMARAEAIEKRMELWPDGAVRFSSALIGWNPTEEEIRLVELGFRSLTLKCIPSRIPFPYKTWQEVAEAERKAQTACGENGFMPKLQMCLNPRHIHDWANGSDCLA